MIDQLKASRTNQVLLVAVIFALLGVCVICVALATRLAQQPRPAALPAPAGPTPAPAATPRRPPEPLKFSGQGSDTRKFSVEGLRIMRMTARHDGERNFIVHVVNLATGSTDFIVNEIGVYEGGAAVRFSQDGDYLLEIEADGAWGVTLAVP